MKPSLHLLPFHRAELVLRSFPKPDRSVGVPKICKAMAANGSPAPRFETDDDRLACVIRLPVHLLATRPTREVTGEVQRLMRGMQVEMSRQQMQDALVLKHEDHSCSSKQRYRLTAKGQQWLARHEIRQP